MRWEQTPVCIGGFGVYERKVIHESKTSCFVQQDRPPLSQRSILLGTKQLVLYRCMMIGQLQTIFLRK